MSGGVQYEIVSPYLDVSLRSLHVTQSADVLFIWHPLYQQRRLSRIADDSWVIQPIAYRPPPSFEDDISISGDFPGAPGGSVPPPVDIPPPPGGEIPPPGSVPTPPDPPIEPGIGDPGYSPGGE
jgi:hypothetical protein